MNNNIKSFRDFVNESSTEFSKYTPINEAEEGSIMGYFTSVMNLSKKCKEWADLYIQKKETEITSVKDVHEMEIKKDEKLNDFEDKKQKLITKSLGDSKGQARAQKRKHAESSFANKKEAFGLAIQAKIDSYKTHMQKEVAKYDTAISELDKDFPITEPVVNAKFQAFKDAEQSKLDLQYLLQKQALDLEQKEKLNLDHPERVEALAKRQKETLKAEEAQLKADQQRSAARATEKEKEWEAKLSSATDAEKDSYAKLDAYEKAYSKYVKAGTAFLALDKELEESFKGVYSFDKIMEIADRLISSKSSDLNEADPVAPATPDKKEQLKTLKTEFGDAKKELEEASAKITKKVFTKIGASEDEAAQKAEDYQAETTEVFASFAGRKNVDGKKGDTNIDDVKHGSEGYSDQAEKDDAVNAAKAEETTAKAAVTAAKNAKSAVEAKDLSEFPGADDAAKQVEKTKAIDAEQLKVTKAEQKEAKATKEVTDAEAIEIAAESSDTSNFSKFSTLETMKHILSFDEFVNESRKNRY